MKRTFKLILVGLMVGAGALMGQVNNVKIIDLNTQTFKQKVWNFEHDKKFKRVGEQFIILDFHATWCRPCKMLAPHLQTLQNKYKGKLIVYKIDVDQEPELAKLFKVEAMPTIVFINSKTTFKTELGYKEYAEYETIVKNYFAIK
jgi:thioredoxin 1